MSFTIEKELIDGVKLLKPKIFKDNRGYFYENFNLNEFRNLLGNKEISFVQDNFSHSEQGVIRGLHYQYDQPQGKLVSVINGKIFDVVVDIRKSSKSFKKWIGIELSSENNYQLWIPKGFAHGFCVLSKTADVLYKVDSYYSPTSERCLKWNDPEININWPKEYNLILSEKDLKGYKLKDADLFD